MRKTQWRKRKHTIWGRLEKSSLGHIFSHIFSHNITSIKGNNSRGNNLRGEQEEDPNDLPELDPTTLWFDAKKVKNVISDTLTGYYREPWRNYGEVDEGSREHFWNLFSKKFKWAPQLNDHVKRTFEDKFANRLRDTF